MGRQALDHFLLAGPKRLRAMMGEKKPTKSVAIASPNRRAHPTAERFSV